MFVTAEINVCGLRICIIIGGYATEDKIIVKPPEKLIDECVLGDGFIV